MRLFLDAMMMTYVAFFEGYLIEGSQEERAAAIQDWATLQLSPPDGQLLHEIEALRALYRLDDRAHFDWLFSDVAEVEIMKIRSAAKRHIHFHLLERLIEHRHDVYAEEERVITPEDLEARLTTLFPDLPEKMEADALQYCEAHLVESDYFLTNDSRFIKVAATTNADVIALRVSELPFVIKFLRDN